MLTKNVMELVAPLAYQASMRGYAASGAANSIIDQVTQVSSMSMMGESLYDSANMEDPKEVIAMGLRLSEDTSPKMGLGGLEPSLHTARIDDIISRVSGKVKQIAVFMPTVVLPFISEVVDGVNQQLADFSVANTIMKELVVVEHPNFIFSEPFVAGLARYGEREYNFQTEPGAGIPSLPDEELINAIRTSAGSYYDALESWINHTGMAQVRLVFENLFGNAGLTADVAPVPYYLRGSDEALFNSVITYYLATYFANNIPEGTRTGPGMYREQCEVLKSLAGNSILQQIKTILTKRSYKTLVHRYQDNQVFVFKDVYEEFIAQGGRNEMILGAYNTDRRPFTLSDFTDRSSELESNWNRALAAANLNEANLRRQFVLQAADHVFGVVLANSFTETELAQVDVRGLRNQFMKEFRALHQSERDNLQVGLALAIARSRFSSSAACAILEARFEILAANPSIESADATSLAIVNYVGDWIADLISFNQYA